jgi:hypothetical protein
MLQAWHCKAPVVCLRVLLLTYKFRVEGIEMKSENRKREVAVAYMQAKSVLPFKMYTVYFASQF